MKKNSFKKLSFVLALAMIIAVIAPAAGAFAAAAPKLNSKEKYLHLGVDGKEEFDFNIKNKKSGWKYAWTSSNKNVANVNAKNGVTMATGVGSAKVTVKITDKDGELVDQLTAKVVVRDNIKSLTITNTPANNKLLVGVPNDFNRSFVTVSGDTTKTSSVTRWSLDKTTGATIDDKGIFVATVPGDYTITANAFQSKAKFNEWKADPEAKASLVTATATYKVTVSAAMTVKQNDKDTFTVTFTAAMNNIDTNLTVSRVVSGYKVKEVVKTITVDADKKIAVVDMYADLTADTVYTIDFPNVETAQFTAAKLDVAEVVDMQIKTSQAKVGVPEQIEVKLLNKEGVDITTKAMTDRVTYTSSNEKTYLTQDGMLSIFTKGEVTTITAVYHTYKYDPTTGQEIGAITKSAQVTGVDAVADTIANVSTWTIVPAGGTLNFNAANHTIAAEDAPSSLYVKTIKTDNKNYVQSDVDKNFSFTSSDSTTLIVQTDANGRGVLYPVKAGVVTVLVSYKEGTTTKVIDAITVNVLPKRVATNLILDSYTLTMSNDLDIKDLQTVKIDVKDQYGAAVANQHVSVTLNYNPTVNNTDIIVGDANRLATNAKEVSFYAAGKPAGTYTYTVKANGITKFLTVNVQAPSDPDVSTSYRLSLDNANLDMKLTASDKNEIVNIKIYGYAANNVANSIQSVSGTSLGSGIKFKIEVTAPDGTPVATTNATDLQSTSVTLATTVANKEVVKLQKGTYRVRLINEVTKQIYNQTTFEVSDTQPQPVLTTKMIVSTKSTVDDAITECFEVKLSNVVVNAQPVANDATSVIGDIVAGKTVYVKHLVIKEVIADGSFINHIVPVNTTITLNR